ncbi:MAG: hypothetical protein AAGG01_08145 [Planctomycetota bacterium]
MIQLRMAREAIRAVQERVKWLEEHNFPIWISHKGEVIDARTLPVEERDLGPDPDSITELKVVERIQINGPGVLDREGWVWPPGSTGEEPAEESDEGGGL